MRVVLIDEEIVAAEALKAGLVRNGVACDAVDYEMDDLIEATTQGCEAVVITVPHSKIDVVRFIEALRHRRIGVPVMVLQSFRNSAQAVELINAGADDVLAKPSTWRRWRRACAASPAASTAMSACRTRWEISPTSSTAACPRSTARR